MRDITAILPSLRESGFIGLSIEEKTDMKEAKDTLETRLSLWEFLQQKLC